ncbi:MAG: FAD-dependent monooxygenase [Cellvibrio sp.]|uniref:FAD-dependent oxidoreductase n=1 Tax=Cellvibrio sp. TaxID=1965322 RepID=UPI0027284164|nr:FAD-dependent monooxygenase [Cellvibrio sp.]
MSKSNAILIVGAGPTGLSLANDLARRKVPFKIIDSKSGPSSDSKGLAINISSQYGLRLIGVAPAPGGNGMPISRLNLYWNSARFSAIDFSYLPTGITSLITQPQAITERELIQSLEATGNRVHWGCKLTELTEAHSSVTASYLTANGNLIEENFSFLIGCDGKHSKVRAQLNAAFEGKTYPMHFVLGDFDVEPGLADTQVHYFVYEDTFFIFVPIAKGTWRIVVKYDGPLPQTPPSAYDISQVIARHFGNQLTLGDPLWISRAPFYNRVAGHLNSKRLFIAGDAAHLFSPIGGTGMNTGIQDALNLGWKLAAVYHNLSHESLLASYTQERLPAIREAANLSDLSTQLITRQLVNHPVLDKLVPRQCNRQFFRQAAPWLHSGLAQRVPLRTALCTTMPVTETRLGQFSQELFYLLDRQSLADLTTDKRVSFWCFISASSLITPILEIDALQMLRSLLLKQYQCNIIYCVDSLDCELPFVLSAREAISDMVLPAGAINTWQQVTLVRPDGLIFYESRLNALDHVQTAIDQNFHFLSTILNSTTGEAIYEEAI